MDPFESFKAAQKKGWAHFAPLEMQTTPCAARLVKRAGVRAGQNVLDVCCGTGVVSVTAARLGARVTGLDLTPELLQRARENARIANLEIDWHEGDVENLPFADAAFDVVLSQFGHIFAPRPEVAIAEMLRVLKPGGTIAFSTWPPELFVGPHVRADVQLYAAPAAGRRAAAAMGRPEYRAATAGRGGEGYFVRSRDDAGIRAQPGAPPGSERAGGRAHGAAGRGIVGERPGKACRVSRAV